MNDTSGQREAGAEGAGASKSGAVFVCPLSSVPTIVAGARARHLVTLLQDEIVVATPDGIEHHLRLGMHDISEHLPDYTAPQARHVDELLKFAERWGGEGPMVVHCWAGISRSTAAAFSALCLVNPEVSEAMIARALRAASPTAQPNRLIVRLADEALGRKGRMLRAVEAMGPAERAMEARPFSLRADPAWLSRTG